MGTQKPKPMSFPFTFEGFKNDLNIMYQEQCGDSFEALLSHYQLDGRITLIIENLNESAMNEDMAHDLLDKYFYMIQRILERYITADLIHSYCKCIKRNNTNHYINGWAADVAKIVVYRKHGYSPDINGVDVLVAAKAIRDYFSYLKDEQVKRLIEEMEDCL